MEDAGIPGKIVGKRARNSMGKYTKLMSSIGISNEKRLKHQCQGSVSPNVNPESHLFEIWIQNPSYFEIWIPENPRKSQDQRLKFESRIWAILKSESWILPFLSPPVHIAQTDRHIGPIILSILLTREVINKKKCYPILNRSITLSLERSRMDYINVIYNISNTTLPNVCKLLDKQRSTPAITHYGHVFLMLLVKSIS